MAFKPGDIVQLKSGGPKMTVQKEETSSPRADEGRCWCKWFAGAKLERGSFHEEELQLYVEESKKK